MLVPVVRVENDASARLTLRIGDLQLQARRRDRGRLQRGLDVRKDLRRPPTRDMDEETRSIMFGAKQFAKR